MKIRILLAFLALCSIPQVAFADDATQAREHFNRGVELLDDSQFAGALEELEKSRAIRETAPVLFNLGLAYRGVGRYLDAIEHFDRFLEVRPPSKHEEMARIANTLVGELRAAIVHVEITVSGGATSVRVDDNPIAQTDGNYELQLDPGRHVFEVRRDGYQPVKKRIEFKSGAPKKLALRADSKPKSSRITVETTPGDAEVWLDDKLMGRGRYKGEITPGTRRLRIVAKGYESSQRTVQATPGARQHISITLTPTSSSQPITKQWWFWAGSAGVIAGAVTAALLLRQDQPTPYEGSLGFVSEALR